MPSTHPPIEEYLQIIAFLLEEGVVVKQARLAERLGHSPQAISEIVLRLEADGYLVRHDRRLELTESGWTIPRSVIRRHRLAERLLVDLIGIPWADAHREAGRYEHIISDLVEERIVAVLGDPATCPHGNPIPSSESSVPARHAFAGIDKLVVGQCFRLERVPERVEDDHETLLHLERCGLLPGRSAQVSATTPDGSITLEVDGRSCTLGATIAGRLLVTPIGELADNSNSGAAG